jgi:hypothetical protein
MFLYALSVSVLLIIIKRRNRHNHILIGHSLFSVNIFACSIVLTIRNAIKTLHIQHAGSLILVCLLLRIFHEYQSKRKYLTFC